MSLRRKQLNKRVWPVFLYRVVEQERALNCAADRADFKLQNIGGYANDVVRHHLRLVCRLPVGGLRRQLGNVCC